LREIEDGNTKFCVSAEEISLVLDKMMIKHEE